MPTAPTDLQGTASSTQVILSWKDNSTNETGFKIERSLDDGAIPVEWKEIAALSANTATYINTSLTAGTYYWYRVRAYNSAGNSSYSNQLFISTSKPQNHAPILHIYPKASIQLEARCDSFSKIVINGNTRQASSSGYYFIVLNPDYTIRNEKYFDFRQTNDVKNFIGSIPQGLFVLVNINHYDAGYMNSDIYTRIYSLGSNRIQDIGQGKVLSLIGKKGVSQGTMIEVLNTNSASISYSPDNYSRRIGEGETLRVSVIGYDKDGDTLSYSFLNSLSGASFNSGTGLLTWTPPYNTTTANKPKTFTLEFVANDGKGGEAYDSIKVIVEDRPPSLE